MNVTEYQSAARDVLSIALSRGFNPVTKTSIDVKYSLPDPLAQGGKTYEYITVSFTRPTGTQGQIWLDPNRASSTFGQFQVYNSGSWTSIGAGNLQANPETLVANTSPVNLNISGNSTVLTNLGGTNILPGMISTLRQCYVISGLVNDGNPMYMTGTDNTARLQSEINHAMYDLGISRIIIPSGKYCFSDTIHLGYGANTLLDGSPYVSILLEGASDTTVNTGAGSTIMIYTGPKDRPAFALTALHQGRMRNLSITAGSGYVGSTSLGADFFYYAGLTESWRVPGSNSVSTWVNPAWSVAGTGPGTSGGMSGGAGAGTGVSTTAPWCAIAVDPYTNSTPYSTAYPDVTFPTGLLQNSFMLAPYQYGKPSSTDMQFEDLFISGFYVGIAVAPGGATNQSDFCRYDRLWIQNCTYGISVNGSNPRENSLKDSYINQCHTAISTGMHCTVGNGSSGQWGAAVINTAFDRSIKWFHFNNVGAQYTGPVTFLNCYSENTYMIGTYGRVLTGSQPDDNSVVLQSCAVNFNHNDQRGVPGAIIEVSDCAGLTINACAFQGYQGAFSMLSMPNHTSVTGMTRFKKSGTPTSLYEKIADNGSGGGMVMRTFNDLSFGDYSAKYISWDTSGTSNEIYCQNSQPTTGTKPGNWYASSFYGSRMMSRVTNPRIGSAFAMSSAFSNYATSLTGRILTLNWNSGRSVQNLALNGYGPGDIIQLQNTGYVFYIYSSTNATLSAVMMTGWAVNSSNVIAAGGAGTTGNGTVTDYTMTGNNFVAQTVTVTFTSSTAFTVSGSVQGAMGTGTVGTTFNGTGGFGFKIKAGTTAFATNNTITMTVTYAYSNGWAPDGTYVINTMCTRAYTPGTYVVGTTSSGTNTITACGDDSGSNTNVATALPIGCTIYADAVYDNTFTNCGPITANSAGTVTLTGNATQSKTRALTLAVINLANAANP